MRTTAITAIMFLTLLLTNTVNAEEVKTIDLGDGYKVSYIEKEGGGLPDIIQFSRLGYFTAMNIDRDDTFDIICIERGGLEKSCIEKEKDYGNLNGVIDYVFSMHNERLKPMGELHLEILVNNIKEMIEEIAEDDPDMLEEYRKLREMEESFLQKP